MMSMNWNYPTPIWFGINRVKEVQIACDNLKIKNPLIVTDPGILKTSIIDKVIKDESNLYILFFLDLNFYP